MKKTNGAHKNGKTRKKLVATKAQQRARGEYLKRAIHTAKKDGAREERIEKIRSEWLEG